MAELTLSDLQKRGGQAVLKKYGPDHFAELGRKSAESKRKKKLASKSP